MSAADPGVVDLAAVRRAATDRRGQMSARRRIVVVGNGMVGQRFCERLAELGATSRYEIVVLSEEALPAYDRVHLSDVIRGRASSELVLREVDWYPRHGIDLRLGRRVEGIDRASRTVTTEAGQIVAYDVLVLATGSRAVEPRIPGADTANVMLYRTLADAENILHRVRSSATELPVVVIGAGLLGLEAARAFQLLGRRVVVLEASSQLLPRQLDPAAAGVLERTLLDAGLEVRTHCRIECVTRSGGVVRIHLHGGACLEAGVAVAAVGARASDELARAAGLRCHPRGGVEVDAHLRTSHPDIFAIGECGSHAAIPHGLVAPGYVMANVLADNLVGRRGKLEPQSAITRLKLDLSEVSVIGDPIGASHDKDLVWTGPNQYRRLLLKRGRIVAAICVGSWDELSVVQSLAAAGRKLPSGAPASFIEGGRLGLLSTSGDVQSWPSDSVVCQCANVTCGTLRTALPGCAGDVDRLARTTGASLLCGSCRPLLVTLCDVPVRPERSLRVPLFVAASTIALLLSLATALLPRVPVAESIMAQGLDRLWFESLFKQLSGYALVALVAIGLLFSLRKRVARFHFSSYANLRVLHALLGALGLIGLFVHTGFRLGSNLNLALMVVFLLSAVSGGVAAFGKTLFPPDRSPRFFTLATYVERAHLMAFWLLPVLVLFHVVKSYYF